MTMSNHTKNKIKKEIASLTYDQLHRKLNEINIELQRGGMESARGQNPYAINDGRGKVDIHNLRYTKVQVLQRLNDLAKKGVPA